MFKLCSFILLVRGSICGPLSFICSAHCALIRRPLLYKPQFDTELQASSFIRVLPSSTYSHMVSPAQPHQLPQEIPDIVIDHNSRDQAILSPSSPNPSSSNPQAFFPRYQFSRRRCQLRGLAILEILDANPHIASYVRKRDVIRSRPSQAAPMDPRGGVLLAHTPGSHRKPHRGFNTRHRLGLDLLPRWVARPHTHLDYPGLAQFRPLAFNQSSSILLHPLSETESASYIRYRPGPIRSSSPER